MFCSVYVFVSCMRVFENVCLCVRLCVRFKNNFVFCFVLIIRREGGRATWKG